MSASRHTVGPLLSAVLAGCALLSPPEPQPFQLYTHCGLDRSLIEFDGDYWRAEGPGPVADELGAPAGFGDPFDNGTIARTSTWTAVYISSEDVRLELTRLDERPDVLPCY